MQNLQHNPMGTRGGTAQNFQGKLLSATALTGFTAIDVTVDGRTTSQLVGGSRAARRKQSFSGPMHVRRKLMIRRMTELQGLANRPDTDHRTTMAENHPTIGDGMSIAFDLDCANALPA